MRYVLTVSLPIRVDFQDASYELEIVTPKPAYELRYVATDVQAKAANRERFWLLTTAPAAHSDVLHRLIFQKGLSFPPDAMGYKIYQKLIADGLARQVTE